MDASLQRIALEFMRQTARTGRKTTWTELKQQLYSADFLTPWADSEGFAVGQQGRVADR